MNAYYVKSEENFPEFCSSIPRNWYCNYTAVLCFYGLSFFVVVDPGQFFFRFFFFFQIPDQESARRAIPGDPYTFTVDASRTGWGEVAIDVVFENRSIRRTFYVEEVSKRIYQVRKGNA